MKWICWLAKNYPDLFETIKTHVESIDPEHGRVLTIEPYGVTILSSRRQVIFNKITQDDCDALAAEIGYVIEVQIHETEPGWDFTGKLYPPDPEDPEDPNYVASDFCPEVSQVPEQKTKIAIISLLAAIKDKCGDIPEEWK